MWYGMTILVVRYNRLGKAQNKDNSIGRGKQEALTEHFKTQHQTNDESSCVKVVHIWAQGCNTGD